MHHHAAKQWQSEMQADHEQPLQILTLSALKITFYTTMLVTYMVGLES